MVGDRAGGMFARWRELSGTVRVRTTAAAVIIVGVVLLIAAVAMVILLRRTLTADVRTAALLRAQAVAAELEAGGHEGQRIPVVEQDEEFVQVLAADGSVVKWSANLDGRPALAQLAPDESRAIHDAPIENESFLAVAVAARPDDLEPLTVVLGRTLESVKESVQAVTGLLAGGIPLLLLVVGAVSWRLVGRALAPVEAIRTEVDSISTRQLHRRVPNPSGRDEIARLATTMNGMLARLEEGQTRQRRFVSDASHELRSPVSTIRQHAEVALAHPDGSTVDELAEIVLQEDIRLQRLVEDLLLLARMDEGTATPRSESVDLDDLVFEEAKWMRRTTALLVDTSGVSAGRVSGDEEQLRSLVRNLTDNAARHATNSVRLTLRENETDVVLGVEDDGEGIPEDERERIFERFVRLAEARDRDSGGSGLGLAIVAEIAMTHGATVAVLNGSSGGARFEVRFPATSG